MREIKFRAWHDGRSSGQYEPVMLYDKYPGDCLKWKNEGQPITIMQYTGLKDRNGVEIYEWDIVSEPYFSNVNPTDRDDEDYLDNTPRKYVICYDSRQAKYKMVPISTYVINAGNGGWTGYDVKYERITVIGNIYANDDLLK